MTLSFLLVLGREPDEIREKIRDQPLPARILRGRRGGKDREQIACLPGGILSGERGRGDELEFKLVLPLP